MSLTTAQGRKLRRLIDNYAEARADKAYGVGCSIEEGRRLADEVKKADQALDKYITQLVNEATA